MQPKVPTLVIDPAIETAETPPSEFYLSPEVHRLVLERAFATSWQFVADRDVARVPGQVYPFTLLEGALDEPLLLTRGMDDQVRCMSNVCTHRGMIVCEGAGNERHLRCRYHGRRFGLDGAFQHMPEFEGCERFPTERDDLSAVPVGTWGRHLFASLSPTMPLDAAFAPMTQRVGWMPFDQFALRPERSREYLVRANWALYVDNYLEGFHIPFIHNSLNETIDYGSYRTELFDRCSLQLAVSKGAEHVFELPVGHPDADERISAYYFWVFPNTMFNFYPWGLSINVVRPLSHDTTKIGFVCYVWDESKLGVGAGAELDRVEREDEAVVEAVQRGLRSRFYDRGRYSPARETGTHHFHRLLQQALQNESDVACQEKRRAV